LGGALVTVVVELLTELGDELLVEEVELAFTEMLVNVFSRFALRMAMGSTIGLSIA
jgi:hypothetical protein